MHIRCTLVIYLYLLDADGVNTIVLATYTFSTGIELWKVLKVLRLRWRLSQYESELRAEAKKQTDTPIFCTHAHVWHRIARATCFISFDASPNTSPSCAPRQKNHR